jgi:hypothetical protein
LKPPQWKRSQRSRKPEASPKTTKPLLYGRTA